MGITIIIQTLLICSISNTINNSPWFSYILMLIFLGGIIILFAYITIIASNFIFNLKINYLIIRIIFFLLLYLILSININIQITLNIECLNLFKTIKLNKIKFNISKLFNNYTFIINLIIINYLFIILIIRNKITNFNQGPLRYINI